MSRLGLRWHVQENYGRWYVFGQLGDAELHVRMLVEPLTFAEVDAETAARAVAAALNTEPS